MEQSERYDSMRHRFDPGDFMCDLVRMRGLIYPGLAFRRLEQGVKRETPYDGYVAAAPTIRTETLGATPIRRQDINGRWYFMPVTLRHGEPLAELELPNAAISMTGKKRIVETALTGRRGTVNELISVDSYEINLSAVLVGLDGNYPEADVKRLRDLYELNEAVELESALSDLILEADDKIVIETIEFPITPGTENIQVVRMTARTDASVELIIE